jgi:hypothetical protein
MLAFWLCESDDGSAAIDTKVGAPINPSTSISRTDKATKKYTAKADSFQNLEK